MLLKVISSCVRLHMSLKFFLLPLNNLEWAYVPFFLQNAPGPVIKALYDVCFNPIIQIVLQSDDYSEMQVRHGTTNLMFDIFDLHWAVGCFYLAHQNATECLAAFVCGGKNDLLAWGGDPGFTMRSLLDALSRYLVSFSDGWMFFLCWKLAFLIMVTVFLSW